MLKISRYAMLQYLQAKQTMVSSNVVCIGDPRVIALAEWEKKFVLVIHSSYLTVLTTQPKSSQEME